MSLKLPHLISQNTGESTSCGKSIALKIVMLCCVLVLCGKVQAQTPTAQSDLFPVLQDICSNYLDVTKNDNYNGLVFDSLYASTLPQNGTVSFNGSYFTYCPTQSFTGTDQFEYTVSWTDTFTNPITATVYINVRPANNVIYPGDADQNGIVEHFDVLAIGLAYGTMGPARDTLLPDALAWTPVSFINTDPGATDCNGDGITSLNDVTVIDVKYNDTFASAPHPYEVDTSVCAAFGIPLYIETLSGDSILDGDSLEIAIMLGEAGGQNSAYGIAFTLEFDNGFVGGNQIQYSTDSSWLGQNDFLIDFKKDDQLNGECHVALSKTNHNPAQGSGEIMRAIVPIDDNIDGIAVAPGWHDLKLHLARVRLISEFDIVREVCIEQPSVKVFKLSTATPQTKRNAIKIYPNPSTGTFMLEGENMLEVNVTDLAGKEIFSSRIHAERKMLIDLSEAAAGSYLATVKTLNSVFVHKIFIQP